MHELVVLRSAHTFQGRCKRLQVCAGSPCPIQAPGRQEPGPYCDGRCALAFHTTLPVVPEGYGTEQSGVRSPASVKIIWNIGAVIQYTGNMRCTLQRLRGL